MKNIKCVRCFTTVLVLCSIMTLCSYAGTWLQLGQNWAYTADGITFADGWLQDSGKIYYIQPVTKLMVTGWQVIDNIPYYFNSDGSLYVSFIDTEKSSDELCDDLYNLVNEYRMANGKRPLIKNDILSKVAKERAMELSKKYSHVRPDGTKCFTLFRAKGYDYEKAAENIAYGQMTADYVMQSWLNSEGHLINMLGDYDETGIGVYSVNGTYYWCEDFAKK